MEYSGSTTAARRRMGLSKALWGYGFRPFFLAAHPLARPRDALRVHRRGDRGVSAYRGAELDGRAGICRMAAHVAGGSVGSRPPRSSNGIAVAVAGRGGARSVVLPRAHDSGI